MVSVQIFKKEPFMKKMILLIFIGLISFQLDAQNSIGFQAGFLGTYTSVAEYTRTGRTDYLLDSVSLDPMAGSFKASINADIDLGKNLFLSTGFHYCNKGLANVTFTDSTGWPWSTAARQKYLGISMMIGYHFHFSKSKLGLQIATGPQADFAIGTPNGGALFSGPYYRFFMPFSRFNEVDLSWATEAGLTYQIGPGDVVLKVSYLYGLSDVMEDAFVVGRSMSFGISVGYAFRLSKEK
jgi:hypothetical protein